MVRKLKRIPISAAWSKTGSWWIKRLQKVRSGSLDEINCGQNKKISGKKRSMFETRDFWHKAWIWFFWDAAFHVHERRKCSFTAKILQRKTKLQISEKYISIRTDAKKYECNFFLHFYSILKKFRAREKPEMVWEEALILNSCCLPTNCSVLLLERQETRDDETSLGKKKKSSAWFFHWW